MNPLRVLIADDEQPARNKMVRMLQDFEQVEVVNISTNGLDAYNYALLLKPDVLFLDIEMPGMNGLEVAQSLPAENRPAVVFATAYNEHAIRAFELNAADYLLKPFAAERLKQTLDKLIAARPAAGDTPAPAPAQAPAGENAGLEEGDHDGPDYSRMAEQMGLPAFNKIPVPTADRYKLIDYDEVVCIEVEERQTNIYTLNKVYPINLTLENFEKRLPPNIFFRISRSCIINVQAIQEIVLWFGNRYKIILANKKEVISSREKSKSLKQILKF